MWSLVHDEEMESARKLRQGGKPPLDEETMGSERDLDSAWTENWPPDVIDQNEPNNDESDYKRAFVNESLPELLEARQRLFWNPRGSSVPL